MFTRKITTFGFATLLLLTMCLQIKVPLQEQTENKDIMITQAPQIADYGDVLSSVLSTSVHYSGLPKVDDIYYKAYPGASPETIVDEFIGGETDWIEGPHRKDLLDAVVAAGHKVSDLNPMAEFTFFPINCRDYKTTSGEVNMPLNDSNFRIALSYIYGVDDKQTDIYNYYQAPWQYAIDNPIPDAQLPWYDASIHMPNTDWDAAWSLLQDVGYSVDGDGWLCKDWVKVRPPDGPAEGKITILYSAGDLACPEGPGGGMVRNFNDFITYIGAIGPTMQISPLDFYTLILELLYYRDFDLVCWYLTDLGVFADWLYDLLHSSNIGAGGSNICGIVDPDFDEWTEVILTSLSVTEVIEACSNVQQKFVYELMPWIPVGSDLAFCTVAREGDPPAGRGELMNIISMPNYGPRNDYSWMTMHWNYSWPGGTVATALYDEPTTLNPYTEESPYGWQMLDRAIEPIVRRDPVTLEDMPWIATNWTIEHWISIPELGIEHGSTATFYIRQDVTWQDGYPVTAYDCVYNMRTMRVYHPERYSRVWANLVYEEADGPYKFTAYFSQTSLYYASYVAETALLAPKHIIEAVEQQVEDGDLASFFDWDPAFSDYADLGLGPPPEEYPWMKQLVGCGPFVFDYYDRSLAVGHVAKYEDFFVNAPAIGSVVGEWRIDPETTYTYQPLIQNIAAKNNTEEGELVPVTVDVKIYEDDILQHTETGLTLDPWEFQYLGPYTTDVLATGEHVITVEVYEGGNLIHTYYHKFVATIKEDINYDFMVDMIDIGVVAEAYGSYPGHLRWDSKADVIKDFLIDDFDLCAVGGQFGWLGGPPIAGDIAVTRVWSSRRRVELGETVDIYVEVENQGPGICAASYVNVILTYEFLPGITRTIDLGAQTVVLDSGTSTVLTFSWEPTYLQIGWYRISAYATPVPYESDTADNTYVDGKIAFTPVWVLGRGTIGKGRCLLFEGAP